MGSSSRTQGERTDQARRNLLAAARSLIAAKGLDGFSLAEVGEHARVSRGLPGYHFRSREALIRAAFEELLESPWIKGELGLAPLLAWMREQVRLAAEGDHGVLALLQLGVTPRGAGAIAELRRRYWEEQLQLVLAHLHQARVLEQVRGDGEAADLASLLVSLLHGEMARVAAIGATPSPLLEEFVQVALAPGRQEPGAAKPRRPAKPTPLGDDLFR